MKIYQINSVCGVGSTGRIATDIKGILESGGDLCRIAYGRGYTAESNTYRIGSQFSLKLHGFLSRLTDRQGFYSRKATNGLIEDIKAYSPDIIHLHNVHGYYLYFPTLFKFLSDYNKPVVWTLHDCFAFTGHCAYFDYVGCDKWKTGCYNCPQKKAYPASFFLDNSKKNYSEKKNLFTFPSKLTLVTPSNWLSELLKLSYLCDKPVFTINNGIDLKSFKPTNGQLVSKLGLENKKIILGVANIWEPRKGLFDFYKLAEALDDNIYQVVLVGLDDKQIRALPKNVIGIKRTSSVAELAELYSAAEFFFNPTYEDNFPTTNLEALACGTPVITYNTGGSGEGLNEKCGAVIDKGDIKSAVDIILKRKFFNEDCLLTARSFDKNLAFNEYIKLYKALKEV